MSKDILETGNKFIEQRKEDFERALSIHGISNKGVIGNLQKLVSLRIEVDTKYNTEYSHEVLPALILSQASREGIFDWGKLIESSRKVSTSYLEQTRGRSHLLYSRGRDDFNIIEMDKNLRRRYTSICLSGFWKDDIVGRLNNQLELEIEKAACN